MDCGDGGREEQQLWRALCGSSLTGKKLAVFEATDAGDIAAQLCTAVGLVYESRYGSLVASWIRQAKEDEPVRKRLRGEHTMDPLHLQRWELERAVRGLSSGSGRRQPSLDDGWMPRPLSSRPRDGEQARARQQQEDEMRDKWAVELYNEMKAIAAPAVTELEICVDRNRLPAALAGKTRASTLRRYVKTWRDWRNWLEGAKGGWDQSSVAAFCEYLFHRFDQPCGPAVPPFIVKAVAWFEKTSMLPSWDRVADSQLVKSVRDHVVGVLSRKSPPVKRAPRYPAVVFEAFEDVVLDDRRCVGFRVMAWVKLIKLWGTLRYDDVQKIIPKELKFTWGQVDDCLAG